MNATEQYFPVLLFIMLYTLVLTKESVDKNLKCTDHSNDTVMKRIVLYKVLRFQSSNTKPYCETIQIKAIEQYFPVVLFGSKF